MNRAFFFAANCDPMCQSWRYAQHQTPAVVPLVSLGMIVLSASYSCQTGSLTASKVEKDCLFFVALCNNCDSNHTCIAAHTCVCPTGLTGNDCMPHWCVHAHAHHNHFHAFTVNSLPADINECEANVAGCEHSCTNFHRGYNCTCENENGYALSRDGHMLTCKSSTWLSTPRNRTYLFPTLHERK